MERRGKKQGKIKRLMVWTILLLLMTFLYSEETIGSSQHSSVGVRLMITDFEKIGGHERFDGLRQALPEMVAVSLIPFDQIYIITRKELWRALNNSKAQEDTKPDAIFEPENIDAVKYDYILRGEFLELNNKLVLSGSLKKFGQRSAQRIEVQVEAEQLFSGVRTFSRKIAKLIFEQDSQGRSVSTATIACFEDRSRRKSDESMWIGSDLSGALKILLPGNYKGELEDYNDTKPPCNLKTNSVEILRKSDVGLIVGGFYQMQDDYLIVTPSIYIVNDNIQLDLPSLKGTRDDYLILKEQVVVSLSETLNLLLSETSLQEVKLIAETKPDQEQLVLKGKRLLSENKTDLALFYLKNATGFRANTNTNPRLIAEAHYLVGQTRLRRGQMQRAINRFEAALEADDTYTIAHAGLGDTFLKMNMIKEARVAYERAVLEAPKVAAFHRKLGNVYYQEKKYLDASMFYENALRLEKDNKEETRYLMLISLLQASQKAKLARRYRKQNEILIKAYEKSIKSTSLRCITLHELAFASRALRKMDEGLRYLEEIVSDEGCEINSSLLYSLAIMQKNSNRIDDALITLRKAEEMSSGRHQLNIQLVIAGYLIHANRKAEGLKKFEKIKPELVSTGQFDTNLAWFYAVANDQHAFYLALEQALRTNKVQTLLWLDQEVDVDKYRGDERFKNLVMKYGNE